MHQKQGGGVEPFVNSTYFLMKTSGVLRGLLAGIFFWAVTSAPAQNFEVLRMFGNGDPADATYPNGLATDGQILYGSASQGGADNQGVLYTIATNGTGFNVLKQFAGFPGDGSSPNELTLGGAMIYGTTLSGGASNGGTIYRLGTNGGGYTVLRTLGASLDPLLPQGPLTLSGATLYGTSTSGGSNGVGTIFRIDTNGANFTVMRHLTSVTDGANPWGKLWLNDATLYGTTREGGTNNNGVLFKINTNGSGYTVIYQFGADPTNARSSFAGLTMVSNVLYGTCGFGGSGNAGAVFRVGTNGSDFTVIHSFTNLEGFSPQAPLTYSQGRLFGTTVAQGRGFSGIVFQLETNGANFRVVKNLTNSLTGSTPKGSLISLGNVLYGAANFSGASNGGSLYRLILAPVITAQPQSVTVTNGQTANFSVSATDESPLTYQWFFNTNTPLAGQTNGGLNLSGVNFGNSGNYTVVVANGLGAVTSSPALLTVVAPPFITA